MKLCEHGFSRNTCPDYIKKKEEMATKKKTPSKSKKNSVTDIPEFEMNADEDMLIPISSGGISECSVILMDDPENSDHIVLGFPTGNPPAVLSMRGTAYQRVGIVRSARVRSSANWEFHIFINIKEYEVVEEIA